jgi:hypothetical protein
MSVAEILAEWEGQELIPLPDLGQRIGLDRGRQVYAIEKGLITPAGKRGANGRYMVDWGQAAMIVAAAALAVTAGIALVTMLRSLQGAGAQVGTSGITIPLGEA